MLQNKQGIVFGIVIAALLLATQFTFGQDSIDTKSYAYRFQQMVSSLSGQYPWNNESFYSGQLSTINEKNETYVPNSSVYHPQKFEVYHSILNSLDEKQKTAFVKAFAYYNQEVKNALNTAGLSLELQYLPAVLSAGNALYSSSFKRAGIWQLTHFQSVINGLRLEKLYDERLQYEKATVAAVNELKNNKKLFEDSRLAMLAYVFGKTKVKNLQHRAGQNASFQDFMAVASNDIVEFMAAYQATAAFLSSVAFVPDESKIETEIIPVRTQIHFSQICLVLPVTLAEVQFYNPQYPYSILPENASLCLPAKFKNDFLVQQDSIYNTVDSAMFEVVAQKIEYPPAPNRQFIGEPVKDLEIEGKTKIKYTIKSGDVLGFIAEDYDVRVADLKYWNNIYNERKIQAGKTLDIFVDNDKAAYYLALQQKKEKKEKPVTAIPDFSVGTLPGTAIHQTANKVEHVVKSGESPYVIAKKYQGVTPEKILEWNNISDARKIQIGQKLIIYVQ
ncbi:LysM peptidoglycan-binding domain-containing protein [uncultured Draconibacterium sp.]|uniref:LysM peptidoglycan-binding domain-containing protein n=1 Tax=uncultured Draconibacterium sp. TaxID=1573823 RepID=UPI003260BE96